MSNSKKKMKKPVKILLIVLIVIAVLTPIQLYVLGSMGGIGPLGYLKAEKIAKLPGNAAEYDFSNITAMENSPLAGEKLGILGSSVARGTASLECAVGEYLAARFDMSLTKEAVGSTTLCTDLENSYVERIKNIDPNEELDLLVVQLSTNDAKRRSYDKGCELGEIAEGTDLADFDTGTVTGAMEYIIVYAQQTWGCPVVFFTGSYYESEEYSAMVDRLLELEEKYGIGVLDLYTNDAFNAISEEDRALYMDDKIHPTKAGYRLWWGPEMEAQLLTYLKK